MRSMTGLLLALILCLQCMEFATLVSAQLGSWQGLLTNAGISSMHTAVTRFDTCIMLDRTNTGPSMIMLAGGICRDQPLERILKNDCYAHSVMFRPDRKTVRPLYVFTDTWCSSGQFFADGTLWQTGGDFEGFSKIRTLTPCPASGTCDWVETTDLLAKGRWYATNQLLTSGTRQIVVGGRSQSSYEFVPKRSAGEGAYALPFLQNNCCDNLYPFVYLLPNGELFIFTNQASINLDWNTNKITKTFPRIPDNPRNYPSGGSAAMLPLTWRDGFSKAEILVCGGAATGASKNNGWAWLASKSCGRIVATSDAPVWAMEDMPIERVMGDMVNMPNGEVLIINGAQKGFQGWGKAIDPVLYPVSYNPNGAAGKRFTSMANGTIPRMYHSTANLLPDARVLCAGSNTHQFYYYTGAFPTEFRLDAYSPPYMGANFNAVRPQFTAFPAEVAYNQVFTVTFGLNKLRGVVEIIQNSAPFVTHSFSQGQRQIKLFTTAPPTPVVDVAFTWTVDVTAASGPNVAPPAYYLFFIVHRGIPSRGRWIKQID